MATEFKAEAKVCDCSYSCDCTPRKLAIIFEEDGFDIYVDGIGVQLSVKESHQLARTMDVRKDFLDRG